MVPKTTTTLVIVCTKCGGLLLAKADQKTKTCSYCGFKVDLKSAKKIASAKNAYEASTILQNLKARKHLSRRKLF